MKILDELIVLIDNLDEDHHDYRDVRAIKRIAHTLQKLNEDMRGMK